MPPQADDQSAGHVSESAQLEFPFMPRGDLVRELRERGRVIAAGARAPRTVAAYDSDWRIFAAWCRDMARESLPATVDTVSLFVVEHVKPWRVSTIERRLAAVGWKHRRAGHADPVRTDEVRELMRGLVRSSRRPSAAKAALSVEELRDLVAAARRQPGPRGLRDAAILLLGFAGGFRRSELAALDVVDVVVEGRDGLLVTVRRGKTDQEGVGRVVAIARGDRADTCPVRAVEAWLSERGRSDGALFNVIDRWRRVLQGRIGGWAVGWVVKTAAAAAGLDPKRYAGHSLRAGLVTAAHDAGRPDSAIMLTTGHKSVNTLTRYMRSSRPFASAPARGLL
jgi:integrase